MNLTNSSQKICEQFANKKNYLAILWNFKARNTLLVILLLLLNVYLTFSKLYLCKVHVGHWMKTTIHTHTHDGNNSYSSLLNKINWKKIATAADSGYASSKLCQWYR